MQRKLTCPKCREIVVVNEGEKPSCNACGFGKSSQPTAKSQNPPKKRKKRPIIAVLCVLAGFFFVVVLIAAIAGSGGGETSTDDDTKSTSSSSNFDQSSSISSTSSSSSSSANTPQSNVAFSDGTWIVPDEVKPGRYRIDTGSSCYWERLSGFSGELEDIEANHFGGGWLIVDVLDSDNGFKSSNCGDWTDDLTPITTNKVADFSDGMFLVGSDISSGVWRATGAGSSCYVERLDGFSGELDEVKMNKFTSEEVVIVEVANTDIGFSSNGCGTWSLDLSPRTQSQEANFEGGHYQVGEEIGPGIWRNSHGESCYWERLSGFSGELDDIISNGFESEVTTVEISDTDTGFWSSGCGTWTKIS